LGGCGGGGPARDAGERNGGAAAMARGGSVGRLEVGDAPDRRAPPVGDRVRE
jgi:hypothetical protein